MPLRDLALTLMVTAVLFSVFKHPVMGAYLWAWLSLMNPHKMTFGFAFRVPFAQIAAVVTMIALLMTRKKQALPMNGIVVVQLLLLVWMCVTSLFAIAPASEVWERLLFVMKIQVMLLVTWMLVTEAKQLRILIWVVTFSVVFFGIKGGIWTVIRGGGGRVWGPPGGMLEDNNALAVALVMLMPMLYFLRQTEPRMWLRHALLLGMMFVVFSILGSQSRGALVAILAMAFFLGLKSKYPWRTSLFLLAFVAMAIATMPDSWVDRMDSMREFEADGSAMTRIWAWTTLWNAAVDNPLVGVGFGSDNMAVFSRYAPLDGGFAAFRGRVYVAHSIYFQMLGEHGFVGFGLFLLLGLTTWMRAGRIAREVQGDEELGPWMPTLMRMVQVSMIGYAFGGAFLSIGYLDLPYYIMGFVVTADALAKRRARCRPEVPAPAAAVAVALRAGASASPPGPGGLTVK